MKRLMTRMTIIAAMVALTCCEKVSEVHIQSGEFNVGSLFTVDGCTAYRLRDNGRAVYYTNCHVSTQSKYKSGKAMKRETVQTDRAAFIISDDIRTQIQQQGYRYAPALCRRKIRKTHA